MARAFVDFPIDCDSISEPLDWSYNASCFDLSAATITVENV
jgi:hypothetical protein